MASFVVVERESILLFTASTFVSVYALADLEISSLSLFSESFTSEYSLSMFSFVVAERESILLFTVSTFVSVYELADLESSSLSLLSALIR